MTVSGAGALWVPAYVGLGSNLDSPAAQLETALGSLAALPASRLIAVSRFYRSPPMGPAGQPDYVNAVAALLTRLPAKSLLQDLQAIEDAQGRDRSGARWGPRTLDLDLLVFGRATIRETDLVVPHPGIAERNFVLLPLREIAPHLHVPGLGSVSHLARQLGSGDSSIERLEA